MLASICSHVRSAAAQTSPSGRKMTNTSELVVADDASRLAELTAERYRLERAAGRGGMATVYRPRPEA
jgi:hypothetical protein